MGFISNANKKVSFKTRTFFIEALFYFAFSIGGFMPDVLYVRLLLLSICTSIHFERDNHSLRVTI